MNANTRVFYECVPELLDNGELQVPVALGPPMKSLLSENMLKVPVLMRDKQVDARKARWKNIPLLRVLL